MDGKGDNLMLCLDVLSYWRATKPQSQEKKIDVFAFNFISFNCLWSGMRGSNFRCKYLYCFDLSDWFLLRVLSDVLTFLSIFSDKR